MNHSIKYRQALEHDVPAMAVIRAQEWGTEEYWVKRIEGYMRGILHPGDALPQRILYVAIDNHKIIGFIAGHLTTRLNCDGELEWINVQQDYRNKGIASELLCLLAAWFNEKKAFKVCVDPDDSARKFYAKHGAVKLDQHWMVWNNITGLLKRNK